MVINLGRLDHEKKLISINYPEKGSKARIVKVHSQTIASISRLSRQSKYVFKKAVDQKIKSFRGYYIRTKKKISIEQCNQKLREITWKSLRHFKATMEYQKQKTYSMLNNC